MKLQIAFYKGKGLIGNALIRWWTKSPYSHVELVMGGVCMGCTLMDGGVRTKVIDLHSGHWDVVDVGSWADWQAAHAHWLATAGEPYSWLDLILCQVFNYQRNTSGASFCSDWVAEALGIPRPTLYSPAALFDEIEFMNRLWASKAAA